MERSNDDNGRRRKDEQEPIGPLHAPILERPRISDNDKIRLQYPEEY